MDAKSPRLTRPLVCLAVLLTALTLASCASSTSTTPDTPVAAADATQTVTVPDVSGQDGDDATTQLRGEGLDVTYEPERDDATGCQVTDQDPIAGTDIDRETDATDVTLTLDCRQVDWENQEGDDWDTFNTAYSDGWDTGCDDVFTASPDGSTLHYDGQEFTSTDCQSGNPGDASSADLPGDVPDDPEADGEALGEADGCSYVFSDLAPGGALYYGTQQFTDAMCPGSVPVRAPKSPSEPAAPKALNAADYRVSKAVWAAYSADRQRKLAALFIANNPHDCGVADPSLLPHYLQVAWGSDYPVSAKANVVMQGFCKLAADGE